MDWDNNCADSNPITFLSTPGEWSKIWLFMDISCPGGFFALGYTGIFHEGGQQSHEG